MLLSKNINYYHKWHKTTAKHEDKMGTTEVWKMLICGCFPVTWANTKKSKTHLLASEMCHLMIIFTYIMRN